MLTFYLVERKTELSRDLEPLRLLVSKLSWSSGFVSHHQESLNIVFPLGCTSIVSTCLQLPWAIVIKL